MTIAAAAMALAAQPAAAQQRSVVNPGFEANNPLGAGGANFEIMPSSSVPGWEATTSEVELWDSGYQGVPAYEGSVFAEMNANQPGTLYQNVCFVNGEVVRWQFAHRARNGGAATQTARFQIANSGGTVLQTLATQSSTVASNAWTLNASPAAGMVYTGPTGVQRLQFSTADAGSYGNFLDGIRIFLSPYIELNGGATSAIEGASSPILPSIAISGEVTAAFNITINVTGGTATRGTDYTTPNGAATFTVAVPAGSYNQSNIPLGLVITNDNMIEANETITLTVAPTPGSYTLTSTKSCGDAPNTTLTHTIVDDDSRLRLRKQWSGAVPGDDATVTVLRGAAVIDTLVSEAGTAGDLDTAAAQVPVVIGETLTFAETLPMANGGGYTGTVTCTGAADANLADGLTIATGETAIVCTMTNVRQTATLQLRKSWAGAVAGHAVTIPPTTGFASNTAAFASIANSPNDVDVGTAVTVFVKATGTLAAESFTTGSAAAYGSVLSCSGGSLSGTNAQAANALTILAVDSGAAIVCTYTNSYRTPLIATKASAAYSDPANGTANPKMIPGGLVNYTITVTNPGSYTVTGDSLMLIDALPAGLQLFVGDIASAGSGPVAFTPGASGLALGFAGLSSTTDDVDFSSNGGGSWTHAPAADASGVDGAITHLRIRPRGAMAAGSSFAVTLRARIR